ncbi:HAD-IA family hydrolase [Stutzerimonas tarimensis]|uniref:HAD-IA family hydrolase n=1 Tax=Stutzerimonas tarimensis TaxID=1507735 RepID=A0ABV7T785_9GAMM
MTDSRRPYDVLIFDWDGTLVDSIGRIVLAMHRAAQALGLPRLEDEDVKGIIGLAMPQAIAALYPGLTRHDEISAFQGLYAECYLSLEAEPSPFYPGVVEMLDAFRRAGFRLAVATGKSRRGLDRVLAGHGYEQFFDITRCADETASKPDPLMLNEILAHCRTPVHRAVMVGDSLFDLQMAARLGMDAVAVSYGAQSAEVLRRSRPSLLVDRFDQLATWLS